MCATATPWRWSNRLICPRGLRPQDTGPHFDVTRMAFEVCTRIEQITPIKSADVLAMVLLGANRRALTATEMYRQSAGIAELIRDRKLPAASGFSLNNEAQVSAAVLALERSGLVKVFDKAQCAGLLHSRGTTPGRRLLPQYHHPLFSARGPG